MLASAGCNEGWMLSGHFTKMPRPSRRGRDFGVIAMLRQL